MILNQCNELHVHIHLCRHISAVMLVGGIDYVAAQDHGWTGSHSRANSDQTKKREENGMTELSMIEDQH